MLLASGSNAWYRGCRIQAFACIQSISREQRPNFAAASAIEHWTNRGGSVGSTSPAIARG